MSLLRLLTQPAVMGTLVQTQRGAWATYAQTLQDFRVSFGQEPVSLSAAFERVSSRDEISPKRWTDDYLAAFATQSGLTLVTFDHQLARRSPGGLLLTL